MSLFFTSVTADPNAHIGLERSFPSIVCVCSLGPTHLDTIKVVVKMRAKSTMILDYVSSSEWPLSHHGYVGMTLWRFMMERLALVNGIEPGRFAVAMINAKCISRQEMFSKYDLSPIQVDLVEGSGFS